LKVAKSFTYNSGQDIESNIRRVEADLSQLFTASQGRVRFGSGVSGERGENISGEFQTVTSSSANTEFTVSHSIGSVPIGFIVINNNTKGVVYSSGTAWSSSAIYLKCSEATATITLFLLK